MQKFHLESPGRCWEFLLLGLEKKKKSSCCWGLLSLSSRPLYLGSSELHCRHLYHDVWGPKPYRPSDQSATAKNTEGLSRRPHKHVPSRCTWQRAPTHNKRLFRAWCCSRTHREGSRVNALWLSSLPRSCACFSFLFAPWLAERTYGPKKWFWWVVIESVREWVRMYRRAFKHTWWKVPNKALSHAHTLWWKVSNKVLSRAHTLWWKVPKKALSHAHTLRFCGLQVRQPVSSSNFVSNSKFDDDAFFCSYRNKKIAYRYIPNWVHPWEIEKSTCNNAAIMIAVVSWCSFSPLGWESVCCLLVLV